MLNNPFDSTQTMQQGYAGQGLIPNVSIPAFAPKAVLGLTQINGYEPVKKFVDSAGISWDLLKSSSDSTRDIPDPKQVQITDYWNHEFPNIKQKVYVYVVEGIRIPRVETERPSKVLYQWFSSVFIPKFDPTMVTDREWMKANVYAAAIGDSRTSKLNAICRVQQETVNPAAEEPANALLDVKELNYGSAEGN